jgi:hypothetical protein
MQADISYFTKSMQQSKDIENDAECRERLLDDREATTMIESAFKRLGLYGMQRRFREAFGKMTKTVNDDGELENQTKTKCMKTVVVAALMVVMLLGIMGLVGLPLLNKMEAKEHTPAPTPVKEEATKDMKVVPEPPVEEKVVRKEEMKEEEPKLDESTEQLVDKELDTMEAKERLAAKTGNLRRQVRKAGQAINKALPGGVLGTGAAAVLVPTAIGLATNKGPVALAESALNAKDVTLNAVRDTMQPIKKNLGHAARHIADAVKIAAVYTVPGVGPTTETAEKNAPHAVDPVTVKEKPPTKVSGAVLEEPAKEAAKHAEKPVKEAAKPVEEPAKETAKPAKEEPAKEAAKHAEEPVKEAAKSAEEPAKEAAKPAEDAAKKAAKHVEEPAKEASKPAEKPAKEAAKPAEEPAKEAAKEPAKPAEEPAKEAAKEAAKPAEEPAKEAAKEAMETTEHLKP